MWSLACVLVELYLGWPLFPGSCEYDQLCYIVQMLGSPPDALLRNLAKASCFFHRESATHRWLLKVGCGPGAVGYHVEIKLVLQLFRTQWCGKC